MSTMVVESSAAAPAVVGLAAGAAPVVLTAVSVALTAVSVALTAVFVALTAVSVASALVVVTAFAVVEFAVAAGSAFEIMVLLGRTCSEEASVEDL